jgi:hypothetical protein|tara:strand:- start:812 stop:928 length:117 start_codon:yes stop_codon:yes gene_type:complete
MHGNDIVPALPSLAAAVAIDDPGEHVTSTSSRYHSPCD